MHFIYQKVRDTSQRIISRASELLKKNTGSAKSDTTTRLRELRVKSNVMADGLLELLVAFNGHTLCNRNRCNPAGLCTDNVAVCTSPGFDCLLEDDLRYLCYRRCELRY